LGVAVYRPDLLNEAENAVYSLLRDRQFSLWWEPQNTADRAIATDLKDIPRKQAAVAAWLASKYRVAPEPMAALVSEAYVLSESSRLKPHLILAVMAIESSFHPYVQSQAGAQGLMQVMTDIHAKKYQKYGGNLAAFDPLTNMRVGVSVLQEYIRLKGGAVEEGLMFYLGGDNIQGETDYVAKVLAEQARLDQVAAGIKVSTQP
jgi:soluble lytic murein transglycosylase-like protein